MNRVFSQGLKLIHRTTGRFLPAGIFARNYPGVPGRIHVDDPMLPVDSPRELRHYVEDAQSAIANIEESLHVVGRTFRDVASCLDLPCGYGRVTRFLCEKVASIHITACDIDPQAIRFCAREFQVKALLSRRDIRAVPFPDRYDLIFVGSLLTHLPEVDCLHTLDALVDVLAPGGVLVFSTQGESCLRHLEWYGAEFVAAAERFRRDVAHRGVCFVPYRRRKDYGITIHAQRYIEGVMAQRYRGTLRFGRFKERGWDGHQDVWSYCRF